MSEAVRMCGSCGQQPCRPGQRDCRVCHAAKQRLYRRRQMEQLRLLLLGPMGPINDASANKRHGWVRASETVARSSIE